MRFAAFLVSVTLLVATPALAESAAEQLEAIESQWTIAAYHPEQQQRSHLLRDLLQQTQALHEQYPDNAAAIAWHGIVARTCISANCGRSNSKLAREARDALLNAEAHDPLVLGGLVYANLGALYAHTPSRFGGFGSTTRGLGYLWKALVFDPTSIEANILYAEVLMKQHDYASAKDVLHRTQSLLPDASEPRSGSGREERIATMLNAATRAL